MTLLSYLSCLLRPEAKKPEVEFTPRARQLVALARKEAVNGGAAQVDLPHLMLALHKLEKCSGHAVLKRLGANPAQLPPRRAADTTHGPAARPKVELIPAGLRSVPYSNNVKKALALAVKEARQLNHRFVGTDHLLLGLLRVDAYRTSEIFSALGVDARKVREEISAGDKSEHLDAG